MSRAQLVRVLLTVNEYAEFGLGEVEYALVILNAGRIRKLMTQIREVKRRKDVDYFGVFDYSPYWLGSDENKIRSALAGESEIEDASRMDCEMRRTNDSSVYWSAVYKHTSVKLETECLYYDLLKELMDVATGKMTMDDIDITNRETLNLDFIDDLNVSTT